MPAMHLMSVDLPAPLSPTSAMTSPDRTSKSTSVSACTEPNVFVRSRISRSGVSLTSGGSCREAMEARKRASIAWLLSDYLQYFFHCPEQTSLRFRNPSLKSRV